MTLTSKNDFITIDIDGVPFSARAGETVAAALLRHGSGPYGIHPVDGRRRAPFCMIGVCYECLVEIDGHPFRQACLERVSDGMRVRRHTEPPEAFLGIG